MVDSKNGNNLSWERSVIDQNGTFYVSLPKIWCNLMGISKQGNILIILQPDGALKIKPSTGGQNV